MVHKTQGCAACKKRKIKCDESRPGCLRCQKVGRQCPGYPDKWDVNFVSENAVVYAKVHSHQEPIGQTPTRRPLPQLVTDDLQAHAINLFFRDYVLDESTEKLCPGWLSFLPVLYQQEGEDSIIHHAVRAAAYANLAQKTDRPDISVKATSHYLKSIAIVNNAISDHQQATSDVTITAVVLLGLYECINSTLSKDISLHHIQGLGALADLRKSLLMEGNASNLVPLICCQMQRRNLDLQLAPGAADDRLVGLLDPTSLDHRMIFNMYEVSKFANQARRSFEVGISDNSLFMTFERLDQHYLSWSMDAKVIWGYNTIQHSIRRLFLPRPKEMEDHIYVGIWTAGVWNKQRSTRIILHQTFLETISKMINDPATAFYNERRAASMSIISDMVEDILASVPFVLGDLQETTATTKSRSVGGYFLVWSLSVILRCPYSTEGQRDEAKHVLERVGKQCGIRYATVYAQSFGGNRQQLETQPLYAFE